MRDDGDLPDGVPAQLLQHLRHAGDGRGRPAGTDRGRGAEPGDAGGAVLEGARLRRAGPLARPDHPPAGAHRLRLRADRLGRGVGADRHRARAHPAHARPPVGPLLLGERHQGSAQRRRPRLLETLRRLHHHLRRPLLAGGAGGDPPDPGGQQAQRPLGPGQRAADRALGQERRRDQRPPGRPRGGGPGGRRPGGGDRPPADRDGRARGSRDPAPPGDRRRPRPGGRPRAGARRAGRPDVRRRPRPGVRRLRGDGRRVSAGAGGRDLRGAGRRDRGAGPLDGDDRAHDDQPRLRHAALHQQRPGDARHAGSPGADRADRPIRRRLDVRQPPDGGVR